MNLTTTTADLQKKMNSLPQVECPVKELLDPLTKTYTRELFIPKGTMLLGKIHKKPCLNIITKGKIIIKKNMEDNGVLYEVPGDRTLTFITDAGSQKIGYALEDTIIINIFSEVISNTLEEVEEELIIPDAEQALEYVLPLIKGE